MLVVKQYFFIIHRVYKTRIVCKRIIYQRTPTEDGCIRGKRTFPYIYKQHCMAKTIFKLWINRLYINILVFLFFYIIIFIYNIILHIQTYVTIERL